MKNLQQLFLERLLTKEDLLSESEMIENVNNIEVLLEKLITFGNQAYPKFGNVVIMAGGGGSGKGFVQKNILGIEGRTFDVDALKEMAIKSTVIAKKVKDETGIDITKLELTNPDDVSTLHDVLNNELNLIKKDQRAVFASVLTANHDRKPNLIFDVTLKDMQKLDSITKSVDSLGYEPKNIHIVWVINDFEIAMQQNKGRTRVVSDDILLSAHKGVAMTMSDIIQMGDGVRKYLDGDIWMVFNRKDDTDEEGNITRKGDVVKPKSKLGGSFIEKQTTIKVKESGKSTDPSLINKELSAKLKEYIPNTGDLVWNN
jgi:hypothetical protein